MCVCVMGEGKKEPRKCSVTQSCDLVALPV
jgi:hypothetical protein